MRLGMVGGLVLYSCGAMATPPVDHFTRYADYEQARISPTGKYLAVTTKMDDFEYLSVIGLAGNKLLYRTHFGKDWDVADIEAVLARNFDLQQSAVTLLSWSRLH